MSSNLNTTEKKLIKKLLNALEMAHNHLEYCGYGDQWERECARESKLPARIEQVIEEATKFITNESAT